MAVIEREGALLLECRADSNRWGLVGGIVEMDESLLGALQREVMEETGLIITDYSLFGTFSDPSRRIQYGEDLVLRILTLVYRVEIEDFGAMRISDESTELRFFPRAELAALDIVETHRHVVDAYLTGAQIVLE
ncbi:MAG: NUDIX domain-containing protein [Chloroflexi bacterium]|nr:NUDIX domain-containing protein [Chloroflexota bacterium]